MGNAGRAAGVVASFGRRVGGNCDHMRRSLWDGLTIRPTVAISARGYQHEAPVGVLPMRRHAIGYAPLLARRAGNGKCGAGGGVVATFGRRFGGNCDHMRRSLWDGLTIRPKVALSRRIPARSASECAAPATSCNRVCAPCWRGGLVMGNAGRAAGVVASFGRRFGGNYDHMRRSLWHGLTIRPTVALSAREYQHESARECSAPATSYCQLLWMIFDSGGVLYLDPVNEFGSRNYGLEVG